MSLPHLRSHLRSADLPRRDRPLPYGLAALLITGLSALSWGVVIVVVLGLRAVI
jgi:hypothetical protein